MKLDMERKDKIDSEGLCPVCKDGHIEYYRIESATVWYKWDEQEQRLVLSYYELSDDDLLDNNFHCNNCNAKLTIEGELIT